MTPNTEQQAVIDFGEFCLDESLMVNARAGTGKTTVLLQVVSKLIGTVWFCAFGNRIAAEIEVRAEEMTTIDSGNVRISTVHAAGNRIWKRHINRGYKPNKFKVREIVDKIGERNPQFMYNKWRLCRMVELAKQSGFGVLCAIGDREAWDTLISHFGLDVEADAESKAIDWDRIIAMAVEVYEVSLRQCLEANMDFSDMLLAPLYYKVKFPQYDNVLIDEAQDISPLRLRLILSSLRPGGRIIAVGDEYQSIFGFTGSDDKSMQTIQALTKADDLPMTLSYRCPKASVRLAQTWVPDIREHPDAIEGVHIEVTVKDLPSLQQRTFWDLGPYNEQDVVLCRNNRPLILLAHELIRRRIPCYVEGKDVGNSLMQLAKHWPEVKGLDGLERKVEEWRDEEVAKYKKLKQNYKAEYAEDQADTLIALMDVVRAEGEISVAAVTKLIGRLFEDTNIRDKRKCISLSTVHKAKGKEWDRVFILGRAKYMPSKWARQAWEKKQEKHLMYVAVTRNKKELIDIKV